MKGRWLIAAAAVGFGILVGRFYHPVYGWTRLLQFDQDSAAARVPALRNTPIFVERNGGGYDGMYYAQIATAPSLRNSALKTAIDNLPYRARRILPSAVAWLAGGGRAGAVVQAYAALNLVVWVALAWLLSRWLPWNDWRGVTATLGILFSAGTLSSVRFALTDLPAMALLAYALAQPRGGSAGAFAAACLCKETSLLALPGLWPFRRRLALASRANLGSSGHRHGGNAVGAASDPEGQDLAELADDVHPAGNLVPHRATQNENPPQGSTQRGDEASAASQPRGWAVLLGLVPLGLWVEYVRLTVGPGNAGIDNFNLPLLGLVHKIQHIVQGIGQVDDLWIVATVLALLGLLVQAGYMLVRWRWDDAWWRVGIVQAGLMLVLGRAVWEGFPGAAFRALLPLTLAFNFYAFRRRAPAWLFLAGNLGVFAGVLTLWVVPTDRLEAGAGRSGSRAAVVLEGPGWYGSEHTWRHAWAWAGPTGRELTFKTWGVSDHEPVTVHCRMDARALSPRRLTIREGDRVCWEGPIGPAKSPVEFDATLERATATLTCTTDQPPVPEARDPGARALAFGIYDLRVAFADARPASR